ncbi:phylloplanin [Asparagus officinalis]|uniref:phylloplanin n=1 Tax=Asparagus officinalis TaxID=4686 RepID=UPI00098E4111|nr:phylloplanin [Asparagus officinalis]
MTSKTLLFAVVLLMIASASSAQAQLLGLSQLLINGTVHCSVGPGSANTAVFPNAGVQLQCGSNVVSTTTTNSNGAFSMQLSFIYNFSFVDTLEQLQASSHNSSLHLRCSAPN